MTVAELMSELSKVDGSLQVYTQDDCNDAWEVSGVRKARLGMEGEYPHIFDDGSGSKDVAVIFDAAQKGLDT